MMSDTIGAIAGIDAATDAAVRSHRPETVEAAEASLHAIFDVPEHDEAPRFDRVLRLLAAARAAHVDGAADLVDYYLEQLEEEEAESPHLPGALAARLAREGADGEAAQQASRGIRALLRHVDLLVQRPAAATVDDLAALTAAGWTVEEIVVLSQVVTFVTYQVRVVHGLRVLQEVGR